MKVIGTTAEGLLVSCTKDELAMVGGYPSYLHYYNNINSSGLQPGTEIKVAETWKELSYLRASKSQLTALATNLREVASRLDTLSPILETALIEQPLLQPSLDGKPNRAVRLED